MRKSYEKSSNIDRHFEYKDMYTDADAGEMNAQADAIIRKLSPAIDAKCTELRAARQEQIQTEIFVLLCVMAIIIPTLLVFAGVSVMSFLIILIFPAVSLVALVPVLLKTGGPVQGKKDATAVSKVRLAEMKV